MNANERYHEIKKMLKDVAKQEKASNPTDKPRINYVINCELDAHLRDLNRGDITEKKYKQIENWLANYACKLHV